MNHIDDLIHEYLYQTYVRRSPGLSILGYYEVCMKFAQILQVSMPCLSSAQHRRLWAALPVFSSLDIMKFVGNISDALSPNAVSLAQHLTAVYDFSGLSILDCKASG